MPPVGPGVSLIMSVFWPMVWITMDCRPGGVASARAGTSPAEPKKQPDQIGIIRIALLKLHPHARRRSPAQQRSHSEFRQRESRAWPRWTE